jgi:hypothetical protein
MCIYTATAYRHRAWWKPPGGSKALNIYAIYAICLCHDSVSGCGSLEAMSFDFTRVFSDCPL